MSHTYYTLLRLNNKGHLIMKQYFVFLVQITYFNTLLHIYKQIFMFLKMPIVIERSAEGTTHPKSQLHSYSDNYLHFSSTMVRSWC
jgi:hypothetical protein